MASCFLTPVPRRRDDGIIDAVRLEPETIEEHCDGQLLLARMGTVGAELHPSVPAGHATVGSHGTAFTTVTRLSWRDWRQRLDWVLLS